MDFKITPHADGIDNPLFEGIHSHLQILIPIVKLNQTHESLELDSNSIKFPRNPANQTHP